MVKYILLFLAFLASGCSITSNTSQNLSPSEFAIIYIDNNGSYSGYISSKEIVYILVQAGTNTRLKGSKGSFECTPIEYAKEHGNDDIIKILNSCT